MTKQYILAHDTGTGGDKAVITDLHGRVIYSAFQDYPVNYPRAEWAEQDPDVLWNAVAATTRTVITQSGIDPAEILGVGVSAQMFNALPVDENCKPVTPMLSWLDMRSIAQADRVLAGDRPRFLFEHTGNIPTAKDFIPKVLWLKEERPHLWARTAYLLDCKEYIVFKLTGKIATDYHGASAMFLFDPYKKCWSKEVCDELGIPLEKLPPALPCTDVAGYITPEAAAQTGLLPGTPVVICAGDVAVAQSGSGANKAGRAHLCIGTATWVGVSTSKFINDPVKPYWGLNHIDPSKYVIAGEMETGGGALQWFRDTFCQEETRLAAESGISTYELISQMAESIQPGSEKLIFTPWLSGERAPVLDHYARGGWNGLTLSHTKAHMARALMEGVGYHIRWICEAMEQTGLALNQINAIGGGATSPVWIQIIADITGRPLRVVEHPQEAGAMGAALAVAVGLGIYSNMDAVDDLIGIRREVEPNLQNHSRYNDLYGVYRSLYDSLAPIYRKIYEAQ
ncbi:MAG TPA: FGGY-family carbohydrate kinase [Longilinea sp.]|nr:FGGY-family carbohydrate kinase [Longilinea sp.]